MNVDKYIKYANYHYPYYDWNIQFNEEYRDLKIRTKYKLEGFQMGMYINPELDVRYFYHEDIKRKIKEIANKMKCHLRAKKNAKS